MAATIEVNKQSVKALLSSGIEHPFVIPEYQRPYAWNFDQVDTLFNDLWEFTQKKGGSRRTATYFLGCIVSFENLDGEQEIIDGQQRITSLFLLLRAIYTKLKKGAQSKESENFIKHIQECIWRANKLTGEVDFDDILLTSRVISNAGNEVLRSILKTGEADKHAEDNYSRNYLRFSDLVDEAANNSPLLVYDFIYALLNQAILMPITADTQDTALTIFSTLNDRGLPLSDADIFKAQIYNSKSDGEKTAFIEAWKELDEQAAYVGESIQQLFYYNMFYLRALSGDSNSTTPGIRKYYLEDTKRLLAPGLMDDLRVILNFWSVVNKREVLNDETWSQNTLVLQALDVLTSYPNEYWKYPVVIYYMKHRSEALFDQQFLRFLRKLIAELLTRYLLAPTINAVKSDILKLNVSIANATQPDFSFKEMSMSALPSAIRVPNRNVVRMMLKIIAYQEPEQNTLLPETWEIEHIFPQKWRNNYFVNVSDEAVKEKIEHIGNKIPFEKRLNIVAGNGYFGKKKDMYKESRIAVTKALSQSNVEEWGLDDITERDIHISESLLKLMETWNKEYSSGDSAAGPTPEQLEMIRKFKENGWV